MPSSHFITGSNIKSSINFQNKVLPKYSRHINEEFSVAIKETYFATFQAVSVVWRNCICISNAGKVLQLEIERGGRWFGNSVGQFGVCTPRDSKEVMLSLGEKKNLTKVVFVSHNLM